MSYILHYMFLEIRAQVTTSLATVEQIRTESLAATATATNIVTELTPSASISDNALEIANETSINAGQQNEVFVINWDIYKLEKIT